MKSHTIGRLLSAFMAMVMLLSFAVVAFAAEEGSVEGKATHTHSYTFTGYVTNCTKKDDSTHTVSKYANYVCSCGTGKATLISTTTEAHSIVRSFTGNHYHIGNTMKHTAEYTQTCSGCGAALGTYWDTYTCPGNGNCIYP